MYRFWSKLYPKKIRQTFIELLRYSGMKINPIRFLGFTIVFGFLLGFAIGLYLNLILGIGFWWPFIGVFVFFQLVVYFVLVISSDAKGRFVESILPDVLQLMASNLRAGLTVDRALMLSARPEFGPFKEEINHIGKNVTMGKEIDAALVSMAKRIKSQRLTKTVALIVSGLASGGELAALLEQTARNLRKEMIVESRIRANVVMYIIFIFVALCIGAPFLFGLSTFLVEVLTTSLGGIDLPEGGAGLSLPLSFSEASISISFVMTYSIAFLGASSILGGLTLGMIARGKATEGIRFMPALIVLSIGIYLLVRYSIRGLLSGLFNF